MKTPREELDPEPFRQWLNRQILILFAVVVIVAASEHTERQKQEQGGSSAAFIEETQLSDPVESGAIPSRVLEEPWMRGYGHD